MKDSRKLAFVALGSNLGDSVATIHRAMARLQEWSAAPVLSSSLWRTAPLHCPPGSPDFINAVCALTPKESETPESLLTRLQALEREFGRAAKKVMNEPRPLDLDLLAFGGETRDSERLKLPHPRARERAFVLQPLAEIAPDLVLPGETRTVQQLLAHLPSGQQVQKLANPGIKQSRKDRQAGRR